MNISYLIKLLVKRWMWIICIPVFSAAFIYYSSNKKPKEYNSTMTIYTGITSGVSVQSLNSAIDYSQALIAYDNLLTIMKSKKTLENVGLRLFCDALRYGKTNDKYISRASYNELISSLPDDLKKLAQKDSVGDLFDFCKVYMSKSEDNYIYNLINKSGGYFSVSSLYSIQARRVVNSDVMEISYKTTDPALCFQTLLILYREMKGNYLALKAGESKDVETYFVNKAEELRKQLQGEEDKMVDYSKQNQIINYEEQSKLVIGQKYSLDDKLDALSMTIEGTAKTISQLEKKLGSQNRLHLKSDQILNIRNEIAKVSAEQASHSFFGSDTTAVHRAYARKLEKLRAEFKSVIDSMSFINESEEGINIEAILNQWLSNVITHDQAIAQKPIIERHSAEINAMFDQYSPIGANLKRSEREIKVTEQQYLGVLDGLHAARSKSQTAKMSVGSIAMLDAPTYPYTYLPNKSLLQAIIALLATFILIIVFIIIFEFIDHTLSNVERAERFTRLKVGFIYPIVSKEVIKQVDGDLDKMASELLAIDLLRIIDLEQSEVRINLISIYDNEGKEYIKNQLENGFRKIEDDNNTSFASKIKVQIINPLSNHFIDLSSIQSNHINILICRANRGWKSFDSRVIQLLKEQTGVSPLLLLNGVKLYVVESQWANFPIKRGKLRKRLKQLLDLEFGVTDKF